MSGLEVGAQFEPDCCPACGRWVENMSRECAAENGIDDRCVLPVFRFLPCEHIAEEFKVKVEGATYAMDGHSVGPITKGLEER